MILFLFENEERKLHGVFQASTVGDINIVTHAYESSGKRYPTQVRRLLQLLNSKRVDVGRRKRLRDYQFENGEVENERFAIHKTLSSGISVVMCNESESSPLDYTAKYCGSRSSNVSGHNGNSGGCKVDSTDIGSGIGTIISEEVPKSLEDTSKDVGTDNLGDFIPLTSPDNS
ncbi:uncharacterized protein LOC133830617 isoform X2 [Humulus lupulus]|uniref:uncharacterized protein LOC133830617 isoform X2 n=1 Tax=Humulus lupulus TaxID=3486 RepID=UPI002B4080B3|nr:uncharacterized protein LOC133830617 isoform X2 [Humulus lupulus]